MAITTSSSIKVNATFSLFPTSATLRLNRPFIPADLRRPGVKHASTTYLRHILKVTRADVKCVAESGNGEGGTGNDAANGGRVELHRGKRGFRVGLGSLAPP